MNSHVIVLLALLLASLLVSVLPADSRASDELLGDWSLELDSRTPAWMSVKQLGSKPDVMLRLYVGPGGPHRDARVVNGRLSFTLKQNKKASDIKRVDVGIKKGRLDATISSTGKTAKSNTTHSR